METLKLTLQKFSNEMDETALNQFISQWTIRKKIKRFGYLTREGKIEDTLYFILKGTFQTYVLSEEKACEMFGYPTDFYCSYASFLSQKPSLNNIQALTDAEVIGISRKKFYDCILNNWHFERVWRLQTEKILLGRINREILLRLKSKERINQFLTTNPRTFQLIPHKYIASYLNMSPENFSRILRSL